ncbi:MAG TPA: hypothetical protein DEG17_13125 [Cyanobacteria bacterium UBA11149]|nr:hypothetical protein [Cyanobacteria bacterium UBA11367]HBE60513.1 hypothetical protein [Cyanobacteria bacterium UBA11366]HBK62531.1 hypothetical protein [Cyanobacteria bacterium UBA11166]HBR75071.1 hypothetical protein [Cyanobacteria bacterium UBA11159]HBS71272.1 hypothetical protein [Cyanobacteria bacterium UBA11153]HBW89782.1 hypothetical protein [Cyanobacteria bacterium UBA11149]HCA96072.1 hypothetical protein [Cyanobacteria bacterium UBA9226]
MAAPEKGQFLVSLVIFNRKKRKFYSFKVDFSLFFRILLFAIAKPTKANTMINCFYSWGKFGDNDGIELLPRKSYIRQLSTSKIESPDLALI